MKKKLRIVLEMDVADLSKEERKHLADMEDCRVRELPRLAECSARQIAEVLDDLPEDMWAEFFDGTGLYARFIRSRVTEFGWLP